MKAEIGFIWDSFQLSIDGLEPTRLRLTVTAETTTEGAMIRTFKRRMGLPDTFSDGMYGEMTIDEPAAPADLLPGTKIG
jgi:hypothetical protein